MREDDPKQTPGETPRPSLSSSPPPDPRGSRRPLGLEHIPEGAAGGTARNKGANSLDNKHCPDPLSQLKIPREMVFGQLNHIASLTTSCPRTSSSSAPPTGRGTMSCSNTCCPGCAPAPRLRPRQPSTPSSHRYRNSITTMPSPLACEDRGVRGTAVLQRCAVALPEASVLQPVPFSSWLGYMHFLVIPLGSHPMARYLSSVHYRYKSFFQDLPRRDLFYKEAQRIVQDTLAMVLRIMQYIAGANCVRQLSIVEATLTYKQKSPSEESLNIIPFVGVVELGIMGPFWVTLAHSDYAACLGSSVLSSPAIQVCTKQTPKTTIEKGSHRQHLPGLCFPGSQLPCVPDSALASHGGT
ncbi:Phosphofurin acidic cluster sorting protein 2 [Myotis davidii]|uniref:Phosphofurin acidic cluster sorting protein 2 n=1 Tax=Myotis davidii TaxID=225400 RepID=L5LH25_MYODS|nr:Phosphofurin acidic cluster sorting protein 2 [Myotis davidii]